MNFTLIKELSKKQEKKIIDYFLQSKPYDFCSLPSYSLRRFKIKEYIDFLLEQTDVYLLEDFFVSVTKKNNQAIVQFIYGQPFSVVQNFKLFREDFLKQNKEVNIFYTEILRKHKKNSLIKFIERRDKDAKIKLDNDKICVLWNT